MPSFSVLQRVSSAPPSPPSPLPPGSVLCRDYPAARRRSSVCLSVSPQNGQTRFPLCLSSTPPPQHSDFFDPTWRVFSFFLEGVGGGWPCHLASTPSPVLTQY